MSDLEKFLAALTSGDVSNLPEPNTNVEKYLAKALGVWDGELPVPLSRADVYLRQLAMNGTGGGDSGGNEGEEEDAGFSAYSELLARSSKTLQVLDGITTIGQNACYMSAFTKVVLPESVVSVGESAFYQNASLVDIQIKGPATLGKSCFAVTGRNTVRTNSIEMPEVVEIGEGAFNNRMLAFTDLNLPKCKTIGVNAFRESWGTYAKLATVNAPECEIIGSGAFYSATPNTIKLRNIKTINASAFYNAPITKLIMAGDSVPTLASTNVFNGTKIASGTGYIYVKARLVDEAKLATNWVTFAAQIYPLVDTVDDLAGIDSAMYNRAYVDNEDCVYIYDGSVWSQE